jgi:hypothetical protein
MALVVKGTAEFKSGPLGPLFKIPKLQYQGFRQRKSPYGGYSWVLQWKCPATRSAAIPSAAQVAISLVPADFEATIEGLETPVHTLTVTTPDIPTGGTAGVMASYYELLGNVLQKDIREHPRSLELGPAVIRTIDCVLNQQVDPNTVGPTNAAGSVPTEDDIPSGDARTLYNLLSQRGGNAHFQVSQFVFRYTRVASSRATGLVNYSNVGKILTTAQMLEETHPPYSILSEVNNAVTANEPTIAPGHVYGWLKQSPTVTTQAGNKLQIVGEYWLEVYSTYMYESA